MIPDVVLLIGFGGPEKSGDVLAFLADVTQGRGIPPERLAQVAKQYEHIGGTSPYNRLTREQAEALEKLLQARGLDLPVHAGFAHSQPRINETLQELSSQGKKNIFIIVMAPQRSPVSYDKYIRLVQKALDSLKAQELSVPEITYAPEWYNRPGFVQAITQNAEKAFAQLIHGQETGEDTGLIFTTHSIPSVMAAHCPYLAQFEETARLVAKRLGRLQYQKAFTSRTGRPEEPWLEPDLGDLLEQMGRNGTKTCMVVPVGFLVDHMEVLYDIETLAQERAKKAGVHMVSAKTVGTHPSFIAMLASLVEDTL